MPNKNAQQDQNELVPNAWNRLKWLSHRIRGAGTAVLCPCKKMNERLTLAGQAGTVEGKAVERAEDGDGDLFGPEELLGERLDFFAGDGVDGG
jgi:hypothetical protein